MDSGKRSAKELIKRYIIFIISLFFSALGVAITKKGDLGVSPISSVGNIMSIRFDMLSLGNWLIIWNCVLILGQILLLRRKFQPVQLLQIPLSLLFGYFTDFGMWLVSVFEIHTYVMQLTMTVLGTIVIAFGVFLSVEADVIMNSGEAFVKALSDTVHKPFPQMKIVFDLSCLAAAVVLSLLFFDFTIVGTREGTIIAAIFTGLVVGWYRRLIRRPVRKLLRL